MNIFILSLVILCIIKSTISIDFNNITVEINANCLDHYNKYVKSTQIGESNQYDDVTFNEYLEYWWNLEETEEELIERVCGHIYEKFPKKLLRVKI